MLAVHSEKDVTDTNVMVCDTFGNTLDGIYTNLLKNVSKAVCFRTTDRNGYTSCHYE